MPQHQSMMDFTYRSAHPLRTLLRLLDLRWYVHLGFTGLFLLKHLPVLLLPVFLEAMVAFATDPQQHSPWFFYGWSLGFLLVSLQNVPTHMAFVRCTSARVRSMEHRLRAALVRRLQQLSITYHANTESGRLQAKVLRDVDDITMLATQLINVATACGIGLAWALILSFTTNPMVGAFMLVLGPLSGLLIHFFRHHIRRKSHSYRSEVEHMSSRVSEMIDIIPVTRAHALEDEEVQKADGLLEQVRRRGRELDRVNGLFASASFTTMYVSSALVVCFATWLAWQGTIPVERIVLYSGLYSMIVSSVSMLLGIMPQIARGFEGLRSLGEVLECPDLEWNNGKRRVHEVAGAVTFRDVFFRYSEGHAPALQNFSMNVPPGECVAFVGESGSGKSTLMNLTIGFFRPQGGEILLDGIPMSELDMRSWRQHVAVVPQQTLLFSGSIRDNITYGLDVSEEQIRQAVTAANLDSVLSQLPQGLDTAIGENGLRLSGGQRQRIAIARAIIRNPAVIILDEATSALDVISEREVQTAIDRLIAGRTTFIVAHRLSTIRRADRVVVMKAGTCVEMGAQDELLAQPEGEFARLKALQS